MYIKQTFIRVTRRYIATQGEKKGEHWWRKSIEKENNNGLYVSYSKLVL